jgi:hypothetical protein
MPHVHLDVLSAHKVVSQKTDMFCVVYRKRKFGASKSSSRDIFFLFFTLDTQKYWFTTKLGMRT